jgi:murein DD-endopeptidase MepM/ murein hydrolase activator NlpD
MIYPTKFDHFGWKHLQLAEYPNGRTTLHPGVDFNHGSPYADKGQDVMAITNGVVNVAQGGYNNGFGNSVLLYHPDEKVWSLSAHLDSINVEVGDTVLEGDKIGELGGTPNYVPHLHFEIRTKDIDPFYWQWSVDRANFIDKYVDPMKFIADHQNSNWKEDFEEIAKNAGIKTPIAEILQDPYTTIGAMIKIARYFNK